MFNSISAFTLLILLLIHLLLCAVGFYYVIKNERSIAQILLLLILTFVPFLGPLFFIGTYKYKQQEQRA